MSAARRARLTLSVARATGTAAEWLTAGRLRLEARRTVRRVERIHGPDGELLGTFTRSRPSDSPAPGLDWLLGQRCVYCDGAAQGNFSIHRDGPGEGPEVPLCDACGGGAEPQLGEIWQRIAERDA